MKTMLRQKTIAWLLAGAMALSAIPVILSAQETSKTNTTNTTGTGDRYKTTTVRDTKGELKPEDARQVSVLGSRILTHVHNAARFLDEDKADLAKTELEHAQTLAKLVREMLPVTVVLTTVNDHAGKEVYRYEDRIQDDQLPIVEGLIEVQVVQPIVDAKKDEAALKGLKLREADLVRTAVYLNLDYVEGKIRQALAKLNVDNPAARSAVLAATANGVQFTTHEEDHPLVSVQAALRLAEQQVRENKHEGAKENLQIARVQLDAYRTLVGESAGKKAGEMEKEIATLQEKTRESGAADKIRGFWNRVTDWFKPESGAARQTTEKKVEEAPKKEPEKKGEPKEKAK